MAQKLDAPSLHFGHHSCDHDMSSNPRRVPIAAFVASAGFHKLQTRFGNVLTQVADNHLPSAARQHPLTDVLDVIFVGLPEIRRIGDHIDIVLGKPVSDRTAVETARDRHHHGLAFQLMKLHIDDSVQNRLGLTIRNGKDME